jgi:N-acetylglutamate synthase-like GNAT family acetyltransferase
VGVHTIFIIKFFKELLLIDNQYIAIKNNEVIGWCDVLPKEWEGFGHVGRLGIGLKKLYRNEGISKRLIESTIEHAKAGGIEKVVFKKFPYF